MNWNDRSFSGVGAQTLVEFCDAVARKEAGQEVVAVAGQGIAMDQFGNVVLEGGRRLPAARRAQEDLSRLSRIPPSYFASIGSELKALNFARRWPRFVSPTAQVQVVIEQGTVSRVRLGESLSRHGPVLEAVMAGSPAGESAGGLRVLVFEDEAVLDISVVSPARTAAARPGDIVAGGIGLVVDSWGGVLLGGALLRLACSNGLLTRLAAGGAERLGRPLRDPKSLAEFYSVVKERAVAAWQSFAENSAGLAGLAQVSLSRQEIGGLEQRLRQAPYGLSSRMAREVAQRLPEDVAEAGGEATMLELVAAISWVGTHRRDLPWRQRFRLRRAGGMLARAHAAPCPACGQLVVG